MGLHGAPLPAQAFVQQGTFGNAFPCIDLWTCGLGFLLTKVALLTRKLVLDGGSACARQPQHNRKVPEGTAAACRGCQQCVEGSYLPGTPVVLHTDFRTHCVVPGRSPTHERGAALDFGVRIQQF